MTVSVSFSGKKTAKKVKTIKASNCHANGQEQVLLEYAGQSVVSGYIDLSQMKLGDEVTITQYMKLLKGSSFQQYDKETYKDVQNNPLIYLTPKSTDCGLKVTLKQTAGSFKNFDHNFVEEC